MTRIVLGLLAVLLLSSCASGSSTAGSDSGSGNGNGGDSAELDARAVKTEVDAEAKDVLPDLVEQVGGDLVGMQAAFTQRGGFGIWDYTAGGALEKPPGTMAGALAATSTTLEQHGYTVETDDAQKRVTAHKGNVSVQVEAALLTDDRTVSRLTVRMGSLEPTSEGDDFAESAPPEDYLAYLG